jgi:hypothetical protein
MAAKTLQSAGLPVAPQARTEGKWPLRWNIGRMGRATRLIGRIWRPVAITACLLGMFWPVAQLGLVWAGVDPVHSGWLLREYFLDRYLAALVLGLVVGAWWIVNVAGFGAIAALVFTFGVNRRTDADVSSFFGGTWSTYPEAALTWLWLAGLIGLGIVLSRQLGASWIGYRPSSRPADSLLS